MTTTNRPTCMVCRKALAPGDQYLVRMRAGEARTVHRHVCFPPTAAPRQTRRAA